MAERANLLARYQELSSNVCIFVVRIGNIFGRHNTTIMDDQVSPLFEEYQELKLTGGDIWIQPEFVAKELQALFERLPSEPVNELFRQCPYQAFDAMKTEDSFPSELLASPQDLGFDSAYESKRICEECVHVRIQHRDSLVAGQDLELLSNLHTRGTLLLEILCQHQIQRMHGDLGRFVMGALQALWIFRDHLTHANCVRKAIGLFVPAPEAAVNRAEAT